MLEFAGRKRTYFGGSIVLAMFGMAASFFLYLVIARIVVIDKGKIVQQGNHEKLMAEDGIYWNFISGRKQAVG